MVCPSQGHCLVKAYNRPTNQPNNTPNVEQLQIFSINGLTLGYLEFGNNGQLVIAETSTSNVHGSFARPGSTFPPFPNSRFPWAVLVLAPAWLWKTGSPGAWQCQGWQPGDLDPGLALQASIAWRLAMSRMAARWTTGSGLTPKAEQFN